MNSIVRGTLSFRAVKPSILPLFYQRSVHLQPWRSYSHATSNGEGRQQTKKASSSPTRNIEHPGPPPPNVNEGSSPPQETSSNDEFPQEHPIPMRPSNNARPTLSDGRQSPNVDGDGNVRSDIPEDVKKHNAEMENRHDRS